MKVKVTLQFEIEDENGNTVTNRKTLRDAGEFACEAIATRMIGLGFLPGDVLLGPYDVACEVIKS